MSDQNAVDANSASAEMPRYQSHKKVWALEIATCSIAGEAPPPPSNPNDEIAAHPGHMMTFVDAGYAPINVSQGVVSRYYPVPGDFYVVYDDGYKSISPRQPFLDGYTKL